MAGLTKLSKGKIRAIVIAAVIFVLSLSLIISNLFVPLKYIGAYFVLPDNKCETGNMRVRFINVGTGDAVFVELPDGKTLLIDGGNGNYANSHTVLKTLNSAGVKKLDYLICTTVKGEHCGGLSTIVKYKKPKTIFMPYCLNEYVTKEYRAFSSAVKNCDAEIRICEFGEGAEGENENWFFAFLSPTSHLSPKGEYSELNSSYSTESIENACPLIWLEYSGISFMFTSDASNKTLKNFIESYLILGASGWFSYKGHAIYPDKLNVLQLSAHGREHVDDINFYDLLKPQCAVISASVSDYPKEEVLADIFNYVGKNLYVTGNSDGVSFNVTKNGYTVN